VKLPKSYGDACENAVFCVLAKFTEQGDGKTIAAKPAAVGLAAARFCRIGDGHVAGE